jgi:hypothetical protein
MGKVILSEFVSLDGVMQDPGGREGFEHGGWQVPFFDEDACGRPDVLRHEVVAPEQFWRTPRRGPSSLTAIRHAAHPQGGQMETTVSRHPRRTRYRGESSTRVSYGSDGSSEWKSWSTGESQATTMSPPTKGRWRESSASKHVRQIFVIARNPEEGSKLPFLLRLPLEGGLVLKARETWPRSARIYCHPFEDGWPPGAEILEETPRLSLAAGAEP